MLGGNCAFNQQWLTKPEYAKWIREEKETKFHKANWDGINSDIQTATQKIKTMYHEDDTAENLWATFKNSLQASIEKNIPSSLARKCTRLPWIDCPLLRLLRWKKKLYLQAKVTRDWSQCYSFQKHCKREIRRAEWQYINKTVQEGLDKNNTKPFWNFVKSKRRDNTGVSPLRDRGTLYSDAPNKSNILLRQFKSAFTLDSEPPPSQPRPQVPSCQQITINTDGVAKLLKSLQVHKAPGPDGIPNTVLQTCADSIAPALTMIFQRSLDTG